MDDYEICIKVTGNIIPRSYPVLTINESFVFRNIIDSNGIPSLDFQTWPTLVYYLTTQKQGFFDEALNEIDFFLLLHSLQFGLPYELAMLSGTYIESKKDFGNFNPMSPEYIFYSYVGEPMNEEEEYVTRLIDLHSLLEPNKDTIMNGNIGGALKYFNDAMKKRRLSDTWAIPNLFASAEALLLSKKDPKKKKLCVRLAAISSNSEEDYHKIKNYIKNMYEKIRNITVHGGRILDSFNVNNIESSKYNNINTDELFYFVRQAFFYVLSTMSMTLKERSILLDAVEKCWKNKKKLCGVKIMELSQYSRPADVEWIRIPHLSIDSE